MATVPYVFPVRDTSSGGAFVSGLTPVFTLFRRLVDLVDITHPLITPIGSGLYIFTYDPQAGGDVAYIIDAGSTLAYPIDRFIPNVCSGADDASLFVAAFRAAPVSVNPALGTYDEAMTAARALALGDMTEDSATNEVVLMAHNHTTELARLHQIPSLANPTARTSSR
jgi:hypothetical protein